MDHPRLATTTPYPDETYERLKYRRIDHGILAETGPERIGNGFYVLLCNGGMVRFTGPRNRTELSEDDLLMLTPGVTGLIDTCGTAGDTDLLYIAPKFFDSLPDGQPLYQQLTWLRGDGDMPFLHLDAGQAGLLRQTLALIARLPQSVRTCRESMLRHLCGVLLLQITDLVSRTNGKGPVSVKHADEIFRSFKRLLVGHYRACHTIGFYARQLHISETYLARIVRRTTGRTVRDQIAELLCADAKKLLECTDLDIKEIADTLGFSDQSVFGKFFLRRTGVSPSGFRAANGASERPEHRQTASPADREPQ